MSERSYRGATDRSLLGEYTQCEHRAICISMVERPLMVHQVVGSIPRG